MRKKHQSRIMSELMFTRHSSDLSTEIAWLAWRVCHQVSARFLHSNRTWTVSVLYNQGGTKTCPTHISDASCPPTGVQCPDFACHPTAMTLKKQVYERSTWEIRECGGLERKMPPFHHPQTSATFCLFKIVGAEWKGALLTLHKVGHGGIDQGNPPQPTTTH